MFKRVHYEALAVGKRVIGILLECFLVTAHKRSLGQGYIFAPVCHSVHRGGGLPHCMPGYLPPSRPEAGTPPGTDMTLDQGRYTPWEQTSPDQRQVPTQHSACWEIWATSRLYASYWNAILLPPANEVWGKIIFLHLSVILFRGGGSASVHAGIADPPGADTPCAQCMLGDMANKWAVCILLECILVTNSFCPNLCGTFLWYTREIDFLKHAKEDTDRILAQTDAWETLSLLDFCPIPGTTHFVLRAHLSFLAFWLACDRQSSRFISGATPV